MAKICERWGCGDKGPVGSFFLLGKTVWLHSSCAQSFGTALLELLNKELSP